MLVFLVILYFKRTFSFGPAFAFTYTDDKSNDNFYNQVTQEGYKAIYVYGGDVETYCHGVGGSSDDTQCIWSGPNQNSWVYYTDYAKQSAGQFKQSGFKVYLNFDGRINSGNNGGYVANFGLLSDSEILGMANATANNVCPDSNIDGMGWDVEPYNTNQDLFFEYLNNYLLKCNKYFGVFAFPSDFDNNMWTNGMGTQGFVLDSTYDLSTPCECISPNDYNSLLTNQLNSLMLSAVKYNVSYSLTLSGSGTTTMYTQYSGGNECLNGGPVYNYTCPYAMSQWMSSAVNSMNSVNVKNDPLFLGVTIYDYTDSNNGGFLPTMPPSDALQVLKDNGYWNGSN